jgi:N utilization substance protein B
VRIDRSGPRHQARIFAMQSLFEHDMAEHDLPDILTRLTDEEGEDLPPPVAEHAIRLARGVHDRLAEIDPYITDAAPAFPMPQLASIDRSVLRLAVYELLFERDVPYRAVINEAVEIAKRFGGPSSGRFVNGVLGTVVNRIPEPPATN